MGSAAMVGCPPPRQCRYVYLRRCVIVITSQEGWWQLLLSGDNLMPSGKKMFLV